MTEHTMKVRIKKARIPSYWYVDKIGQTFEVHSEEIKKGDISYYGCVDRMCHLIEINDCEVIEEPRPFKVGDPVEVRVKGYVESIDASTYYPINIIDETGRLMSFTLDGRPLKPSKVQTLFHDDTRPPMRPDLPVDQLLRVWNTERENPYYRRFAKWHKDGRVKTWKNGADSKTNDGLSPIAWDHYEVVEE